MVRPHVVTLTSQDADSASEEVYVGGGSSADRDVVRTVFKYSTGGEDAAWVSLPITRYHTFSLAAVAGRVTVIGGMDVMSGLPSSTLVSLDRPTGRRWEVRLPAMPTARYAASAAASASHLVVAGGFGLWERGEEIEDTTCLATVELLDLNTMTWSSVAPLPIGVTFMSIASCDQQGMIYLLGGLGNNGAISKVISCRWSELVKSSGSGNQNPAKPVWSFITSAPNSRSGCLCVGGKLVTMGGMNNENKSTVNDVSVFDPVANTWCSVGKMAASRSSCSLALLSNPGTPAAVWCGPEGEEGKGSAELFSGRKGVLVVGGYLNPRNWMTSLTTDVMEVVNFPV